MSTPSVKAELNAVKPLPHGQAIEFWKKRLPLSPEDYRALGEMRLEAQTRAFTVADISSIDALMTIHDALGEALKHGESFGDFKKRIREQITANGWGRLCRKHLLDHQARTGLPESLGQSGSGPARPV